MRVYSRIKRKRQKTTPLIFTCIHGFVTATKLGTKNKLFVVATKNFAAATKRFVNRTKDFVVVTT